ncbi:MAG: hypothetical protein GC201_06120 [Alphaproteobacteria bacterium]|nr:hypothetical protein [Alphaproteobacteria bacterium]
MPYFANKTDDYGVDEYARQGGRRFAQALEAFYRVLADLEVGEEAGFHDGMDEMAGHLAASVSAYDEANEQASAQTIDIRAVPAFDLQRMGALFEGAGRMGIWPESMTEKDLFAVVAFAVDGLRDAAVALRQEGRTDFDGIDRLLRAMLRAQETALASTRLLERSYLGRYTTLGE